MQRLRVVALGMHNRRTLHVDGPQLDADLEHFGCAPEPSGDDTELALSPGERVLGSFFFVHESQTRTADDGRAAKSFEFLHNTFGEFLTADFMTNALLAAAVLSGLLAVAASTGAVRAGVATGSGTLLIVAVIWGACLLLGLPATAAPAITLGAVPVALRALPSILLDVPPGMFIDYERFQRTRWSVRQQLPEPGGPVTMPAVSRLVDESSARLLVGTAVLCGAAALSAPFAVPAFDGDDPIVLGGQIGVLACAVLALLFGARRFSAPALHWLPRIAAVVVLCCVAASLARLGPGGWLVVLCALLLLAGLIAAAAAVPVARGARSLSWSRAADVFEWLAVALSLPAGLLAAGAIELLRGMMAT